MATPRCFQADRGELDPSADETDLGCPEIVSAIMPLCIGSKDIVELLAVLNVRQVASFSVSRPHYR
jgi:hypothetical protein